VQALTRTWEDVAASLAEAMSEFEDGTVLILVGTDKPDGRYVQIWQDTDAIWVEVSSSNIFGAGLGVSKDVEQRIGDLGWTAPEGRDNWRMRLPWPATAEDYRTLAGKVVTVWRDVFGFDSPERMRYSGFISTTHERLVLPQLGLEPAA
jgi:hypothetical protein